jgi:hypothetical protein
MTAISSVHYLATCRVEGDPEPWFLSAEANTPGSRHSLTRRPYGAKNYARLDEIDAAERAEFDACAERVGLGPIQWNRLAITMVSYQATREHFMWNAVAQEEDDHDAAALEAALRGMIARATPQRRGIAAAASCLLARMQEFHAMTEPQIPAPMALWGGDHWSTLAYAETVLVEHQGRFQVGWDPRMRQAPERFSDHWWHMPKPLRPKADSSEESGPVRGVTMDESATTRLNDGSRIPGHDDWSCISDMIAAGIFVGEDPAHPGDVEPGRILVLTPYGRDLCAALRAHKASPGGKFATFRGIPVDAVRHG